MIFCLTLKVSYLTIIPVMANKKRPKPFVISPYGRKLILTDYQERLISTVRSLIKRHGASPTYQEIAAELGISKSNAVAMVRKLVARGFLLQIKGQYRTIRPNDKLLAA